MCNFKGFVEPEMIKVRPIMVVSPKLPCRSHIVAIVPISLLGPTHDEPYVVRLSKNYHPLEENDLPCWAKCDMITNIGLYRLEGFKLDRRKWATPQASAEDLESVRAGVLHGLGVHNFGQ